MLRTLAFSFIAATLMAAPARAASDYEELARQRAARDAAEAPAREAAYRADQARLWRLAIDRTVALFASRHCGLATAPVPGGDGPYKTWLDFTTRDGFACRLQHYRHVSCVQRGTLKTDHLSLTEDAWQDLVSPGYRAPRVLCPGPGFQISDR